MQVKGRTLFISGVDLVDGTPILDVKPYIRENTCVSCLEDGSGCCLCGCLVFLTCSISRTCRCRAGVKPYVALILWHVTCHALSMPATRPRVTLRLSESLASIASCWIRGHTGMPALILLFMLNACNLACVYIPLPHAIQPQGVRFVRPFLLAQKACLHKACIHTWTQP
jgi:hypothetical protein